MSIKQKNVNVLNSTTPSTTPVMSIPTKNRNNLFFTCAVHLQSLSPSMMKGDPVAFHSIDEAIAKMHRFCHEIYSVPITWLCNYAVLQKYGEQLARFARDYGDEVAILESGIASRRLLDGREKEYQSWVEECGLKRPDEGYHSKEPGISAMRGFCDMSYDEQKTALTYLKSVYDRIIGQNTRVFACPHQTTNTIRVLAELGFSSSWGYCWNYFCEGINHKGSLFFPFYISKDNHDAPEQKPGKNSLLAALWAPFSPVIGTNVGIHSRNGEPGYCLNAMEMTNRSEGLDQLDFHRKVIQEWAQWARWNSFIHIPLQLEAIWMDEGKPANGLEEVFPTFNSFDTEVFYTQIETALRCGARPMTLSGFADWHKENIGDTSETLIHSEDLLPALRSRGKDQTYQPFVAFGSKKHQYWFNKANGFNYIRKYCYSPVVKEKDIADEYPYETEPRVCLRIKHHMNMRAGVTIGPNKISYELADFDLTADNDEPDYAAILWQANIPSYMKDSDIEIGGAIKSFRSVREKNICVLFADLKKGLNKTVFRSDVPGNYIRIKRSELVGRRYEIWFENDREEVCLHTLETKLPPGLKLGGFWWDGHYSRTLFRYGWCDYDRDTGRFLMKIMYPDTLKVNQGLTRFSVELL